MRQDVKNADGIDADMKDIQTVNGVQYRRVGRLSEEFKRFGFDAETRLWISEDQQKILISRPFAIPNNMLEGFRKILDGKSKRNNRFLLTPENLFKLEDQDGGPYYIFYYIINAKTDWKSLTRAVGDRKFPLPQRIAAGMNLAEAVDYLETRFGVDRAAIHPDSFLINIATGEVSCFLDQWLKGAPSSVPADYDCYYPPEWHDGQEGAASGSGAAWHFLAAAEFRLLCMDNPFDDVDSLCDYPCLTRETRKKIYGRDGRFLFDNPADNPENAKNRVSEFIGATARQQWGKYPLYLRRLFYRTLSEGLRNPDRRADAKEWTDAFRRLRDCLVPRERNYHFIDPEEMRFTGSREKFSGLVLKINPQNNQNNYVIPLCPKKAVYWYHAGLSWEDARSSGNRGIIGAVIQKSGSGLVLQNRCDTPWIYINKYNKDCTLPKDAEVELTQGLRLFLPKPKNSGDSDDAGKAFPAIVEKN